MIETNRLSIIEADEKYINLIIRIESHEENRYYLWIGTYDEHLDEINDPNHLLLVIKEKMSDNVVGYALVRLDKQSNIFELRRIAITKKGVGYGKEAMIGLIRYAFEQTDTNRFWLDVYPTNYAGIKLYDKLGLHVDGVLRSNYKDENGYLDQIVYSLLKEEYDGWLDNIKRGATNK
ncbi:MAG: GNAT family protein [Erysipelotrichales bacterium]